MTDEASQTNFLLRWVAPRPLFAGMVLSFLVCCWGGRLATQDNHFVHFKRFHQALSPSGLYFPTVSQTRQYVKHHAGRRQILVIVGGSSVLQGTGQTEDSLWSTRLQEQLGDEYKVINLAMQAARANEVGFIVAESLANTYKKLIVVVDVGHSYLDGTPDGLIYKYFYWDAWYKGLLLPYAARSARLQQLLETPVDPRERASLAASWVPEPMEARREGWLDSRFYFNDLWSTLAYTTFFTVWTPFAAGGDHFYKPRRDFPDLDQGAPPMEQRYQASRFNESMESIRRSVIRACTKTAAGDWVLNEDAPRWEEVRQAAINCFPKMMREHTLFVIKDFSPYYTSRLAVGEQRGVEIVQNKTIQTVQEAGFPTVNVTGIFGAEDFMDQVHLAPSGGEKFATVLSARIRELAKKLGYTQ